MTKRLLRSFETFFPRPTGKQGKRVLLVVDEAQSLRSAHWKNCGCCRTRADGARCFKVFFLGQPQFNVLAEDPQL
jgi:hypothetical protein